MTPNTTDHQNPASERKLSSPFPFLQKLTLLLQKNSSYLIENILISNFQKFYHHGRMDSAMQK